MVDGETLKNALSRLRSELPVVLGDTWPEVAAELDPLLRRLDEQPGQVPLIQALILDLLGRHPAAHRRLIEVLGVPEPAGTRGVDARPVHTDAVTRYTDIACPRRVWIETPRFSVVVRLTVRHPALSAAVHALELDPTRPVRVALHAPGCAVLGGSVQVIGLAPSADSLPVVFDLRPKEVIRTTLTFDFFQGDGPVGTVVVPLEISAHEVSEGAEPRSPGPLVFDPRAVHPDMVLHVAVEEHPPALVLSLIRDGGASWTTFAPVRLVRPLAAYADELYRTITNLATAEDPTALLVLDRSLHLPPQDVDRSMKKLGQELWRSLIPAEMKALYGAEREHWRDRSVLVLSDEPHVPWELVWPYDEQGRWHDDDPWCGTLDMTRWLRRDDRGNGNAAPPVRLTLCDLAVVAPEYSILRDLPGARAEQEVMRGLIAEHALQDVSPPEPTWGAVLDLLESGAFDWLHSAAHGTFRPAAADGDSALWLEHDRALTPSALVGPEIEAHLRRRRPGFFFNACETGREDWSLTRIGGWANRLIGGGAGLFIAPLWIVQDDSALDFARAFYEALFAGEPVAAAARRARLAARRAGDPTWMAYSVYAHPRARVTAPPP